MLTQLSILIIGLILLYFGSSLLVAGAASTAALFLIRPVVIGLTIVSFATSAPELLVSLVAAVMIQEEYLLAIFLVPMLLILLWYLELVLLLDL